MLEEFSNIIRSANPSLYTYSHDYYNKINRYFCIDLYKQRIKSQENRTLKGRLKNCKTKLILLSRNRTKSSKFWLSLWLYSFS